MRIGRREHGGERAVRVRHATDRSVRHARAEGALVASRHRRHAGSARWASPSPARAATWRVSPRRPSATAMSMSSTGARRSSPTVVAPTSCCSWPRPIPPSATPGISLLLVDTDTPGFHVTRRLDKVGMLPERHGRARLRRHARPRRQPARRGGQGVHARSCGSCRASVSRPRPARARARSDTLDSTIEYVQHREAFGQPHRRLPVDPAQAGRDADDDRRRPRAHLRDGLASATR